MIRLLFLFVMFAFVSAPLLFSAENQAQASALQAVGAEETDLLNEKDIDTLDIGKEIGLEEELEEDEFDEDDDTESIGVEEIHT